MGLVRAKKGILHDVGWIESRIQTSIHSQPHHGCQPVAVPSQQRIGRRPVAVGHQSQKAISIGVLMRHGKFLSLCSYLQRRAIICREFYQRCQTFFKSRPFKPFRAGNRRAIGRVFFPKGRKGAAGNAKYRREVAANAWRTRLRRIASRLRAIRGRIQAMGSKKLVELFRDKLRAVHCVWATEKAHRHSGGFAVD
jgi:hypothetical protein